MQISSKIFEELKEKTFNPTSKNAVVGLDGFVDKIVTPVDKRHGLEDNFDPIETIGDLGSRISAAAGKSACASGSVKWCQSPRFRITSIFASDSASSLCRAERISAVSLGGFTSTSSGRPPGAILMTRPLSVVENRPMNLKLVWSSVTSGVSVQHGICPAQ